MAEGEAWKSGMSLVGYDNGSVKGIQTAYLHTVDARSHFASIHIRIK